MVRPARPYRPYTQYRAKIASVPWPRYQDRRPTVRILGGMDVRTVLPCDASSVGKARRLVRRQVASIGDSDLADAAGLLTSELVTNAIVHARTDVEVCAFIDGDVIRVEVSDGSSRMPRRRRVTRWSGTGRGLLLMEKIATRWGVRTSSSGKTVWFEL